MLTTIQNAFKTPEIRKKMLFVLIAMVIVRIGCNIPIPGVNADTVSQLFNQNASLGFLDVMTGGSFSNMSIFALNISPYITASIILQLLTIAIPRLEEMQKDGEDGRKKINEYTRYLSIVLAIIEATALIIGFGNQGLFNNNGGYTTMILAIASMVAGAAFMMWFGEQITERGVGNGISIILLINIVARIPSDLIGLWDTYIVGGTSDITGKILIAVMILAIIVAMFVFIVFLQGGERRIPVQYAKKVQGRKVTGGQSTHIPLKVNTAGVIPVIFASSMMSLPVIIGGFAGKTPKSGAGASFFEKMLKVCNQSDWFNITSWGEFKYTLGFVVYIALIIFFAYFYTSVTFNPLEISNNMKKQGGFIPGIRPGKPTTEYLTSVLNSIVFIGAIAMVIICGLPIVFSGVFGADVSFSGTSLIIVVGVVIETIKQIESLVLVRHYKGFLGN